jgi:amino-acid N-acetyltransferase
MASMQTLLTTASPFAPAAIPAPGAVTIRRATPDEAAAIFELVTANIEQGHLLPRTFDDIVAHAGRFLVLADEGDDVLGCGELAPLGPAVAEIRSLVVDARCRGVGLGSRLVTALKGRARLDGYRTLCAFTHEPTSFVRQGFSIVPHQWLPEKIATDCHACPLFRRCGQYAVAFPVDRR